MSEYHKQQLGALVVVTPATGEPITRTETKQWLGVEEDETTWDALVDGLIATSRRRFEEFYQRSLRIQTFDWYLDEPPCGAMTLPRAPLVSVVSIRGFSDTDLTDTGGVAMSSSGYYVDTASMPGRVIPIGSATYPVATRVVNALITRFTAGYSSGSSGVPDEAKTILKRMIAAGFEHRGDEGADVEAAMNAVLCEANTFVLPEWG